MAVVMIDYGCLRVVHLGLDIWLRALCAHSLEYGPLSSFSRSAGSSHPAPIIRTAIPAEVLAASPDGVIQPLSATMPTTELSR